MKFAFSFSMRIPAAFIIVLSALSPKSNMAQQLLLKIPSGEQTDKKGWTATYRGDYYKNSPSENLYFTYGKKRGTEWGINLLNMRRNSQGRYMFGIKDNESGKTGPLLTGNYQKRIKILKNSLVFGIQAGAAIDGSTLLPAWYHYGLYRKEWRKKPLEIVLGYYTGNANYNGAGDKAGAIAGFVYKVKETKDAEFRLLFDFMSGRNHTGGLSGGIEALIIKRIRLTAAYQIPTIGNARPMILISYRAFD
jgi:hypothetical protein